MRVLIDGSVRVWWWRNPALLSTGAREVIREPSNEVWFGAVSIWELGGKIGKGKLRLPQPFAHHLRGDGFQSLAMTSAHGEAALSLPPILGDPFDRMLIAQAMHEQLVLGTRDELIRRYLFQTLPA